MLESEIAVTRMSSKGQIVIPSGMRRGFHQKEQFIIVRGKDSLILRSAHSIDKALEEDLEFAKRTERALRRYEKGKFRKMSGEDFLKALRKW
jgi:bifunctional DNA-binding transcriptional regulator/antitoxin component of YhaV-PrlF toxin-antitoxin module